MLKTEWLMGLINIIYEMLLTRENENERQIKDRDEKC